MTENAEKRRVLGTTEGTETRSAGLGRHWESGSSISRMTCVSQSGGLEGLEGLGKSHGEAAAECGRAQTPAAPRGGKMRRGRPNRLNRPSRPTARLESAPDRAGVPPASLREAWEMPRADRAPRRGRSGADAVISGESRFQDPGNGADRGRASRHGRPPRPRGSRSPPSKRRASRPSTQPLPRRTSRRPAPSPCPRLRPSTPRRQSPIRTPPRRPRQNPMEIELCTAMRTRGELCTARRRGEQREERKKRRSKRNKERRESRRCYHVRAREGIRRSVRAGSRDEPRGGDFQFAAVFRARTHAKARLAERYAVKPRKTPLQSLRAFPRHNIPKSVPRAPTPVFERLAANGQIGGRETHLQGQSPITKHPTRPTCPTRPTAASGLAARPRVRPRPLRASEALEMPRARRGRQDAARLRRPSGPASGGCLGVGYVLA